MADEEAESKDTKTPEEAPGKSDESSAKDDADGSEDEIIEEIAEDEACIDACSARPTYNDVFATLKGSGYSLSQARNSAQTIFTTGQYMYIWAWLHDANGNLYKRYGRGTVNMTLAI